TVRYNFNREALAIEIDLNIPVHRVVRILERLSTERGYPAFIRSDNGPEFIAAALVEWAEHHGVILDMYLFRSLSEVRTLTEDWRTEYNEERPHSSLGNMPPVIYARQKL
ncbi:integrase, partial [Yersinia pestis]